MTKQEAIAILVDIAQRWGENAEEAFPRRLKASDTDADLEAMLRAGGAKLDFYEFEDAKEVRDLWRAIEVVNKEEAL